jgi:glycosyltransferase involved in cell wall biosynthesis
MGSTIAVLITYHNEGPLLTECLESLRNAERLPDEILVHDDASTSRPERYLPLDLPVRVIRSEENRGPSRGRNILLAACQSTWVHFQDADDLFAPGWCNEVRAVLERNAPDVLFTAAESFRDARPDRRVSAEMGSLATAKDLVRYCLEHSPLPACGTYRRETVLAIGGYSEQYWQSEDQDFHIRLALTRPRFEFLARPLVWQRLHANNRSSDQVRVWSDAVRVLESAAAAAGPDYQQDICNALARAGRKLYQLGAVRESKRAFDAAASIGHADFPGQPAYYRIVAKSCGPLWAERVGSVYRHLLPASVRSALRAGPAHS